MEAQLKIVLIGSPGPDCRNAAHVSGSLRMDFLLSLTFPTRLVLLNSQENLLPWSTSAAESLSAPESFGLRLDLGVAVIFISSSAHPFVCAAAVGCLLSRLRLRSVSRPLDRFGRSAWLVLCVAESRRGRPNQHGRQGNGEEERS